MLIKRLSRLFNSLSIKALFDRFRVDAGKLSFAFALLFNTYSITALLLTVGLVGDMQLVVALAIVQGATLATFHLFSANARNLILGQGGADYTPEVARLRGLLVVPLLVIGYVLAATIGHVDSLIVIVVLVRRACEWFGEIGLAEHERINQTRGLPLTVFAEIASLLLFIVLYFVLQVSFVMSAAAWAIAPLTALRHVAAFRRATSLPTPARQLLFNVGSSAIVGITVYAFRVCLVSLVDQRVAGELLTAFAIGGIIPSILGQALGPTLLTQYGNVLRALKKTLALILLIATLGALLAFIAIVAPNWLPVTERSQNWFLAIGLSLVGGALMTIAVLMRARFIHLGQHLVLGPDLVANALLLIALYPLSVAFGEFGLAGFYLLSAVINLLYFYGFTRGLSRTKEVTSNIQICIVALLLCPLFFLLDGSIFYGQLMDYANDGRIQNLPIPLAVMAVFLGIAMIANYAVIKRSMLCILSTILLAILVVAVRAGNSQPIQINLSIVWPQVVLPMMGLLLGEMYVNEKAWKNIARVATVVLLTVLSAQHITALMQGNYIAGSSVFLFDIYQYFIYFPTITVAITIFSLFALWHTGERARIVLTCLLTLVIIQVVTVASLNGAAALTIGVVLWAAYYWQDRHLRRPLLSAVLISLGASVVYTLALGASHPWSILHAPQDVRNEQWQFFANAIINTPQILLTGSDVPLDRYLHPSAYNYWLDVIYRLGVLPLIPLITLLVFIMRKVWEQRLIILKSPLCIGTTFIIFNIFFIESMFGAGLRQPYSGLISFFILGCLIAQLKIGAVETREGITVL